MAAKAFGPVWGLFYPLHHGACVVGVLSTPTLRYSSADDPGPPLDTAKLHFCLSWQEVWHTPPLSSSAFPALPLSLLLWLCLGSLLFGTFRLFMQSPLPSLRRVTSGAKIVASVFLGLFGVPSLFVDVV